MRLSFKRSGTGDPLLILHGLFGSGTNWRTIARHYESRYTTYLLDLRNHGRSPHADSMDYAALATDVRQFMDEHDLASSAVISHSMGGKTAMQLALETPPRVSKLVVVDIAPAPSAHNHLPVIDAIAELDLGSVTRRADADALLTPAILDAGLRAFILQNLEQRDGRFVWRLNLVAIRREMAQLLSFPAHLPTVASPGPRCSYGAKIRTMFATVICQSSKACFQPRELRLSPTRATGCTPNDRKHSSKWSVRFSASPDDIRTPAPDCRPPGHSGGFLG